MEILENFKELQIEKNFAMFKTIYSIFEKDKNKLKNKFTEWIYKKFFDEEIFYAEIDIRNLEQNELQKIDSFIKERLNLFSNLFPNISLENTKNYDRENEYSNKTYIKEAKKSLKNINSLEAVKISMHKKFTKDHITNSSYFFKNNELEARRKKIVSYLSTELTINDIVGRLKLQIRNSVPEYLNDNEINSLAVFMGSEVYFRTKKQLIYCKNYRKIEEEYSNLEHLLAIFIRNDIDKILADNSSDEGIEKAKERIDEYIKK